MKKLLVIVDVQNDFVDGALGTKEAQEIVPRLVEKIKNWDGDFLKTLDTHTDKYLETKEGKNLPILHCIMGTHGWFVNTEVDEAIKNAPITQACWTLFKDTFGTDGIGEIINKFKYDYVEFVGLCTDVCVVSNALITRWFVPEVELAVDASCCAGVTPEKHNAALDVMESCQIKVLNRGK